LSLLYTQLPLLRLVLASPLTPEHFRILLEVGQLSIIHHPHETGISQHKNPPLAIPLETQMIIAWSSPSTLAIAIAVHSFEEAIMLPLYQKSIGLSTINTKMEILLDNLPVFLILPFSSEYLTKVLGDDTVRLVLATICLLHPLSDHVYFTNKLKRLRPGSITAIFLLLPLGFWNILLLRETNIESHLSSNNLAAIALGSGISFFSMSQLQRS
jgi:hypothetical protein